VKPILKFAAFILLSGVLFHLSCKKEYSCENCKGNKPPIANAGADQIIVLPKDSVMLDGIASADPDGTIVTYKWIKIAGPSSFTIINSQSVQTKVDHLVQGVYQFELKVIDNGGLSAKDTIQIIVNPLIANNISPVAKAGNDTTIQTNQTSCTPVPVTVTLNGNSSYDPDGIIINYLWTGPGVINNPNSSITIVSIPVPGISSFILKVTDNNGASGYDTVQITTTNINRPLVPAQLIPIAPLSQNRTDFAIASAGNKILFAGGYISGSSTYSSRVDIYDVNTNTWTTNELSQPRNGITTAVLGNKIFFAGGYLGTTPTTRVDIYDVATSVWSTAELSIARRLMAGAAAGNHVVFAGGIAGFFAYSNSVDIYNALTNTWSTSSLAGRTPTGTVGMAATVIGNKIFFAGEGSDWYAWDFGSISSTINIYDVSANTWSVSNLNTAKGFMAGIAAGNKNYWAGGLYKQPQDPFTNEVEIRDVNSGSSSLGCLFQPNAFFSAVQKNNKIVFFTSGYDNLPYWTGAPPVMDKFDIYDIFTDSWSIGVLPVNIYGSSIISLNNTIYVAGGYVNGVLSNQVWKLDF
jgi:hypothetical protein